MAGVQWSGSAPALHPWPCAGSALLDHGIRAVDAPRSRLGALILIDVHVPGAYTRALERTATPLPEVGIYRKPSIAHRRPGSVQIWQPRKDIERQC